MFLHHPLCTVFAVHCKMCSHIFMATEILLNLLWTTNNELPTAPTGWIIHCRWSVIDSVSWRGAYEGLPCNRACHPGGNWWYYYPGSLSFCPVTENYLSMIYTSPIPDDVITWKRFLRYWHFVRGIHWSPVNSPHKGQAAQRFDVFFDIGLNKQWCRRWFETLWRSCDVTVILEMSCRDI